MTVWHSLVYVEMGGDIRTQSRAPRQKENKQKKTGTVMTSPETERLSSITGWCQTLVIFLGLFCEVLHVLFFFSPPSKKGGRNNVLRWYGVYVPSQAMWFSGHATTGGGGGVIISPCHRCISLEYVWFYTLVTQLCMFAFALRQRHSSCHILRKRSKTIFTKL